MHKGVHDFANAVGTAIPKSWYDVGRKEYMVQDASGDWMPFSESQYKRSLKSQGLGARAINGEPLSEIDGEILRIQNHQNVHYAGPIAGFVSGYHEIGSTRVLVTTSPRIIEPREGDWDVLRQLIEGLLGADGGRQLPYFYGWLKIGYESLRAGKLRPGQAIAMVGPHGCGKSLLQNLITVILGGRSAKPFQAMTGGTTFNSDLIGAEHLVVEDEQPSTEIRARRSFGAAIKSVTVNETQRLHAKHRDALLVKTFWRLTISLNSEVENIQVLPPLDDSLEDKIMLFNAEMAPKTMATDTLEEREQYWKQLTNGLPGFLSFLCDYNIPPALRCRRFGVTHFHHPTVLAALDSLSPEVRLLSLLDHYLFSTLKMKDYEGTAEDIEMLLTDQDFSLAYQARNLLSWSHACGNYLGRLAKKRPDRVQRARTATERKWRIIAPSSLAGRK